ncbi:putative lipid II flippase FtsW [Gilvimarinus sp. F26214L]|uniref:putative lipid II flippase FtsW n=1 Tax=Gilvimarinus sp. DZF01 TaxID=3461371 RepID=UPI0040465D17
MIAVLTRPMVSIGLRPPANLELDWVLLGLVITLASAGVLMVASASMSLSESVYGSPWYILQKHAVFLSMGLFAAAMLALVPAQLWQQYGWVLLLLTLVLLLAVLIPGLGKRVNGSQRWLMVGPISVQASEAAKLLMVMFFASYLARRHHELKSTLKGVIKPLLIVGLVVGLLLLEPDFGGSVVLAGTIFAMMFIAGMKLWHFLGLVALGTGLLSMAAIFSPYRMERLVTFLDPWADQFDSGYQLTQSLIAFGQGEWFGVGLGRSVQKLFYLPDAHTDFIFAIVAEEFGLLGAAVLIVLFGALVWRIFLIGQRAIRHDNHFAGLAAFGIGILFAGQAFINMGVASGLLPTKGLTLPFVSYGGSSLIISCMLIGIVLRLDWELSQPVSSRPPRKGRAQRGR